MTCPTGLAEAALQAKVKSTVLRTVAYTKGFVGDVLQRKAAVRPPEPVIAATLSLCYADAIARTIRQQAINYKNIRHTYTQTLC